MYMNNKFLIAVIFLFGFNLSLNAQLFKGTIIPGSAVNSVMLIIKPSGNLNGQITNLQFVVQIPNTISPQPTATIKSNPLSAYVPTANYVKLVTNEGGYYTYIFGATTVGAPVYNFTGNTPVNALEIQFGTTGATLPNNTIRFASLADGGTSFQANFYVEIAGDYTDYAAPFYGTGATNGGSPTGSAYSFVPLNGVSILIVKFTSFSATKKDNDALLNWSVVNESANAKMYEVERSVDGANFEKINSITPLNNGSSSNVYNIKDENLSAIKNNGLIYYRIKQIDQDGKFTYSEIRSVKTNDKSGGLQVYPNPVKDFTTVRVEAQDAAQTTLLLMNAEGKQIQSLPMNLQKGLNAKKIDLSNVAAGTYLLKAEIAGETKTISLIKL